MFLINSSPSQILFPPPLHHDRDADAYHGLAIKMTSSGWVDQARAWQVYSLLLYWTGVTELFVFGNITQLVTSHNFWLNDNSNGFNPSHKYIVSMLDIYFLCSYVCRPVTGKQVVSLYLYTTHYVSISALWAGSVSVPLHSTLCLCISPVTGKYLVCLYLYTTHWKSPSHCCISLPMYRVIQNEWEFVHAYY